MLNKKSAIALTLIIALTASMMFAASQTTVQTSGQVQYYVTTYLYVTAEPNPVGVGQTVYLSLFFTKPLPPTYGAAFGAGYYHNLTMNLVKPGGGANQTFGPYTTDGTGGVGGLAFVPTAVGNYTIQAFYPGEYLIGSNDTIFLNAAMSTAVTFMVQEEPIPTYSAPPLPTEYWSRPIYATNYNWAQLGGNWYGLGKPAFMLTGGYDAENNNFNQWTEAPNTAHILWTKPTQFGGQPGEPINANTQSQYTSTSILYHQFEGIILNGVLYYDQWPSRTNVRPGRLAVDIRTGETLWHQDYLGDSLAFGQVLKFHTIQEYGSIAWLWAMTDTTPRMFKLYEPLTGAFVANVTDIPSSLVGLFGSPPPGLVDYDEDPGTTQGSVLIYWVDSGNLVMWNSSRMTTAPSGNINFTRGIQWRVPIPTNISGNTISPALGIAAVTHKGIVLQSYPAIIPTFLVQFGGSYAIDAAFDYKTGALLWGPVNRTLPLYDEVDFAAAGEGYYVRHNKDTNEAYGYSLTNGQQLWGPVQLPGNSLSTLQSWAAIAYGNVYVWDFGGFVNAIDLKTGKINWTFTRGSAGYDTPYGVYPIWGYTSGSIADGKIFLSESRMYDPPLFMNAHRLVLNCTDGSLVWSINGFYGRDTGPIADGFSLAWNSYDGQIYTFGKGQTDTTATIQDTIVPSGESVLITGTVLDKSPGTKDSDIVARFPNGVPAVSDDSMTAWMEYVYSQQPKPSNASGVDVTIDVIDSNNNYRNIGTVTTDPNGFYSFMWQPDISGKYTVIATFKGSESYWSSTETTAFGVMEAPEPTQAPTSPPASIADQYFIPGIGIIVAAIAIVGIVLAILLRKR